MQLTMYLNGRFVPQDEGLREMQQMGQSIGGYYDTERTFDGEPFRLRLHLERLYNGINYSGIDVGVTIDEMEELTLRVLESNRPLRAGSELTITQLVALTEPDQPDDPPHVTVAIYCQPLDVGAFASSYNPRCARGDTGHLPARPAPAGRTPSPAAPGSFCS